MVRSEPFWAPGSLQCRPLWRPPLPHGPLDFEQRDRYHLQLLAHDGPHEGRANLTVFVEDVNDNSPAFSQTLYQVPVPHHHHPRAQGCS